MTSQTEFQLIQYVQAQDPDNNAFVDIGDPTTDLTKLIAEALINSEDTVMMILNRSVGSVEWRRWYVFYKGKEIHI